MRWKTLAFIGGLAAWSLAPRPAAAVDLALVLLNDVSKSMDMTEYALVKDGYRAAFSDPEVIAALLSNGGGIAVAYVEFSGKDTASGKSWEGWVRRWNAKKQAEEQGKEVGEIGLYPEELD